MAWYIDLLNSGGLMFMVPLALMHLALWAAGGIGFFGPARLAEQIKVGKVVLFLTFFSFFFGLFAQTIALVGVFDAVEQVGNVKPALLAGGMKVSFIPTVHGMYNLLLGMVFWLINRQQVTAKNE